MAATKLFSPLLFVPVSSALLLLAGCPSSPIPRTLDGGRRDAATSIDASAATDAAVHDGGASPDAAAQDDAGQIDDDASAPAEDAASPSTDGGPRPATWTTDATDLACVPGRRHAYRCAPRGTPGTVRGTGIYSDDSSICGAAVHAGRITTTIGGMVEIELRDGLDQYDGSARYGVTSTSDSDHACSFAIVGPSCPGGRTDCGELCVADHSSDPDACGSCGVACDGVACRAGECAALVGWTTTATAYDCNVEGVVGSVHSYTCPSGGTAANVWGSDIYTHDSSVCTAAVHAGRIALATGGVVAFEMLGMQASFTGATRNGITSTAYGAWYCAFQFR